MQSIYLEFEVYINNQQNHNSNGLYAHKFYNFTEFKIGVSEYKEVLCCGGYECKEFKHPLMTFGRTIVWAHLHNDEVFV